MKRFSQRLTSARDWVILVLTAAVAAWSVPCQGYGPGCCGCCPCPYYPGISALDTPLRPYNMPRRPAWGGHDFRYHVEMPTDCRACGPVDGTSLNDVMADELPFPAELAGPFAPLEFERLGQIPNDSLLDVASGSGGR